MCDDYTKGNTEKLAAEWRAYFTVSKKGRGKVSSDEIDAFFFDVIDAAEKRGLVLGGGMMPLLDDSYREDKA